LITVVVPPALPATLSIGTSFALARLRKAKIFCVSPNRVNVSGKVNVVCFDKTGTLTEDGLDILGVRIPDRLGERFGELVEDARDLPLSSGKMSFLHALATCHSLKMVDGSPLGDPLDMKMFSFTDWTLEEGEALGATPVASKSKGNGTDKKTALVQSIVRPPGTSRFRIEDALKTGRRVNDPSQASSIYSLYKSGPLHRTGRHQVIRICICSEAHERDRQTFEKLEYGDIRKGSTRGDGRNL
jgi:cation-transporting ATPase 13A2